MFDPVFIEKYKSELEQLQVPSKVRDRVAWDLLHPKVVGGFLLVANRIVEAYRRKELTQLYLPFDGFRSPLEQLTYVRQRTSKAMPWQSAHNYGMAVDFAGWNKAEGWNWKDAEDPDWKLIGVIAVNAGMLRPIAWDKPHVEHPLWTSIKRQVV